MLVPSLRSSALMIGTAIIHNVFGLLLGLGLVPPPEGPPRNLVGEMLAEGLLGTAAADPLRMTFFWFEFSGALFFLLGWSMLDSERRAVPISAALGWQLLGLALVGVLLVPASGLWLLLPQAALVVRRAQAATARVG